MIFRKGELFCGPGGLTLGAYMATEDEEIRNAEGEVFKVKHAWANDIDKDTCETFRLNIKKRDPDFKDESVIEMNVKELNISKEFLPPINAFAFGFPCNDFSNVGETQGLNGKYGPLYTYGVKVLDEFSPIWFIAENVGGLQSANEGQAFAQIMNALQNAGDKKYGGYKIVPHLYKFEEYGVPQARHRIIIVGIRNDWYKDGEGVVFRVPARTTPKPEQWVTAKQALEKPYPAGLEITNNEKTVHQKQVEEMLNYIDPGENAWSERIPERLRLNVKGAKLSNIYKRLHPDQPAYTVTGSGGGGTHMYHYKELRALTNRERARLQTFPDDFVFVGKKESVRKQVGMAVPPKGAAIIIKAILKSFAGIPYPYEEPKWDEEYLKALQNNEIKTRGSKPKTSAKV